MLAVSHSEYICDAAFQFIDEISKQPVVFLSCLVLASPARTPGISTQGGKSHGATKQSPGEGNPMPMPRSQAYRSGEVYPQKIMFAQGLVELSEVVTLL